MRFEIGPVGGFVILLGLAGLSAGVFALGMVAGHQLAAQQATEQVAAEKIQIYPLPTPPAAEPSAASMPESMAAKPPPIASTSAPLIYGRDTLPTPVPVARTPSPEIASRSEAKEEKEEKEAEAPESSKEAKTESPPPVAPEFKHQPYSVQIEAVMDKPAADQMVEKLKSKGFDGYVVETTIGDQKWYRVRVGHYASKNEASAAQVRLSEQFAGSFSTQ
jgi:cell division septation protein DedD